MSEPTFLDLVKRLIERSIRDRTELAHNGGGEYSADTDPIICELNRLMGEQTEPGSWRSVGSDDGMRYPEACDLVGGETDMPSELAEPSDLESGVRALSREAAAAFEESSSPGYKLHDLYRMKLDDLLSTYCDSRIPQPAQVSNWKAVAFDWLLANCLSADTNGWLRLSFETARQREQHLPDCQKWVAGDIAAAAGVGREAQQELYLQEAIERPKEEKGSLASQYLRERVATQMEGVYQALDQALHDSVEYVDEGPAAPPNDEFRYLNAWLATARELNDNGPLHERMATRLMRIASEEPEPTLTTFDADATVAASKAFLDAQHTMVVELQRSIVSVRRQLGLPAPAVNHAPRAKRTLSPEEPQGLKDALRRSTKTLPDCGEAGHDEGRCGNASCSPKARPAPPPVNEGEIE